MLNELAEINTFDGLQDVTLIILTLCARKD